jgi:hypothetical protein
VTRRDRIPKAKTGYTTGLATLEAIAQDMRARGVTIR